MAAAGAANAFGGFLRAWGTLYEATGQKISLRAQARAKEQEALVTREKGLWESMRLNEERRRVLAAQRELYGSAGVTLEGTPTDIQRETKREFVLDRMMLARNRAQEVSALWQERSALRKAASRAQMGGAIGAFASFFG